MSSTFSSLLTKNTVVRITVLSTTLQTPVCRWGLVLAGTRARLTAVQGWSGGDEGAACHEGSGEESGQGGRKHREGVDLDRVRSTVNVMAGQLSIEPLAGCLLIPFGNRASWLAAIVCVATDVFGQLERNGATSQPPGPRRGAKRGHVRSIPETPPAILRIREDSELTLTAKMHPRASSDGLQATCRTVHP